MSDLAKRLRAAIDALGEGETYAERNLSNLAGEAADALDKAEAERDSLQLEVDRRCFGLGGELIAARRERDAAEASAAAARPLATFGLACLDEARQELGDLDGGWIEDKATELGVLTAHEVTEPCRPDHEGCRCVEYGFPATCMRDSEAVKAYRAIVAACQP